MHLSREMHPLFSYVSPHTCWPDMHHHGFMVPILTSGRGVMTNSGITFEGQQWRVFVLASHAAVGQITAASEATLEGRLCEDESWWEGPGSSLEASPTGDEVLQGHWLLLLQLQSHLLTTCFNLNFLFWGFKLHFTMFHSSYTFCYKML